MATPTVLRIAYLKSTSDLALAKAHGSLERALAPLGARVEWAGPFGAAAPAIEALNAGAVDLTVGSSTAFITARAAGVALALFAYQRLSPAGEAILVAQDSPLHSVRDLVGRKVAVNRGGTGEYILVRALTRAGVPLDQVQRVYLGPMDANAAFAQGAVDAWVIWDPFIAIAVTSGGARVLADGAACGSENAVAYFVTPSFLQAHRPVVKEVLSVLSAENAWGRAHQDEAGAIWAHELELPPALGHRLGQNNTPPIGPVGAAQAREVEHIADWYVENRIIPQRPEIGPYLVDLR
jgi:sulfonate transport system substrate-binding protein